MNDVERELRDDLRVEVPDELDRAVEAMIGASEVCTARPARARRLVVALLAAAVVVAAAGATVWIRRQAVTHRTVVVVDPGPALQSALVPSSHRSFNEPLARRWHAVETVFLAGDPPEAAGRRQGS